MTKTLYKKIIPTLGHIIKIISNVQDLTIPSGISDEIIVDILVNDSSILSSGQMIILSESNLKEITIIDNYTIYPKDEVKVILYYEEGLLWNNINVVVRCSKI